jgi:hypothetical protein
VILEAELDLKIWPPDDKDIQGLTDEEFLEMVKDDLMGLFDGVYTLRLVRPLDERSSDGR